MIQTANGDYFRFDGPYRFDVRVIAAALSKLCRFTGHCRDFYSVAQHSVHVSEMVAPEFAFEALLHDAQEAYLGDVATPLKRRLIDYQTHEVRVEAAMRMRFSLPVVPSPEVKHADLVMLATERRDLMPWTEDSRPWSILEGIPCREAKVVPWTWQDAERIFLRRFQELVIDQ